MDITPTYFYEFYYYTDQLQSSPVAIVVDILTSLSAVWRPMFTLSGWFAYEWTAALSYSVYMVSKHYHQVKSVIKFRTERVKCC